MADLNIELSNQLNVIADYLKVEIQNILEEKGHRATGELIRSIENTVSKGSDMYVIEGSMALQGRFIITGREKGKKGVPVDALVKWIENKNFSDGIKSTRGLAFAIQKSIIDKGIKPNDFIGDVFDRNRDRMENSLLDANEKALDLALTNLINNAKQFA